MGTAFPISILSPSFSSLHHLSVETGAHVDQAGLTSSVAKDDLELQTLLFLLHSVFLGAQLLKRDLLMSMFGDRFVIQYISLKASPLHLRALDLPTPLPQTQRLSTFHALFIY